MKVYLVYARETTDLGFSSEWQDHRRFELRKIFTDLKKAGEYRDSLFGEHSAYIKEMEVTE